MPRFWCMLLDQAHQTTLTKEDSHTQLKIIHQPRPYKCSVLLDNHIWSLTTLKQIKKCQDWITEVIWIISYSNRKTEWINGYRTEGSKIGGVESRKLVR